MQARTSRSRPRIISPAQEPVLAAQFLAHREATIAEHVRLWAEQHPPVSPDAMRRTIRRLGWRFKKNVGGRRARPRQAGALARRERPLSQRSPAVAAT